MTITEKPETGYSARTDVDHGSFPTDAELPSEVDVMLEDCQITVERYLTAEFARTERDKLWANVWQMTCREDELAAPGDFHEYQVGDRSFLIVRQADGGLRAFHNVCPHRGNILKSGSGSAGKQIVCNFHLWSFNLDGSLKRVQDRETFCPLPEESLGLRPASVDTWAGWVFLHPSPEPAESLLEFLSPLPEQLEAFKMEYLVPVGLNATTSVSANWKIACEAFLENYHTQGVHPQILPMHDDYNIGFQTHSMGRHSRMIMRLGIPSPRLGDPADVDPIDTLEAMFGLDESKAEEAMSTAHQTSTVADDVLADRKSANQSGVASSGDVNEYFGSAAGGGSPLETFAQFRSEDGELVLPDGKTVRSVLKEFYATVGDRKGVDFSGLTEDQLVDDWHTLIFPNVVLNITIGGVLMFRFHPDADDPNKCTWDIMVLDWVGDAEARRKLFTPNTVFGEKEVSFGVALDQDAYQMPRVQRGLRSGAIDHVTLSKQEIRLIHFNRVLDAYVADQS